VLQNGTVSERRTAPNHLDYGVTAAKAADLVRRMAAVGLNEADLRERFIRGSGPGGQKVNKTANVCQLTHVPTGEVVTCGAERSRGLNRFLARRRLVELLEAASMGPDAPQAATAAKIAKQKARRRRRGRSSTTREESGSP